MFTSIIKIKGSKKLMSKNINPLTIEEVAEECKNCGG
jgi:hypothetical protein